VGWRLMPPTTKIIVCLWGEAIGHYGVMVHVHLSLILWPTFHWASMWRFAWLIGYPPFDIMPTYFQFVLARGRFVALGEMSFCILVFLVCYIQFPIHFQFVHNTITFYPISFAQIYTYVNYILGQREKPL
jgi:hypothetical protein